MASAGGGVLSILSGLSAMKFIWGKEEVRLDWLIKASKLELSIECENCECVAGCSQAF